MDTRSTINPDVYDKRATSDRSPRAYDPIGAAIAGLEDRDVARTSMPTIAPSVRVD